uniref:Uncharacterized protein n=1 Tax=Cucumis sativus TaxID=3659 RepID=A0A0A0LK10_CUCSA
MSATNTTSSPRNKTTVSIKGRDQLKLNEWNKWVVSTLLKAYKLKYVLRKQSKVERAWARCGSPCVFKI